MPSRYEQLAAGSSTPRPGRSRFESSEYVDATAPEDIAPVESTDDNGGLLATAGGALALAVAARLGIKHPGAIGTIAKYLNAGRQQLMLSGLAVPKSVLGNVGAAVTASVERGSTRPIRELLSKRTLQDAVTAYRNAPKQPPVKGGVNLPGPMPGRFMGAADEATQKALQRAGLSADDAQREVLQSPLTGSLGEVLESPVAQYMHPFRRTPFNQFIEGYRTLKAASEGNKGAQRAAAVYAATGGAHGAATADEQYPVSVPLGIAASGRYGMTYGLAALLARSLSGGRGGGGIAGSVLPVSEYGVEQSLNDPLRPFREPAAFRAIERLSGGR